MFRRVVMQGELGVHVFFVISGFLISSILLRELAQAGHIDLRRFYFRRTLRIFPAFYCYLGVIFAAEVLGIARPERVAPIANVLPAATYASDLVNLVGKDWFLAHAWSLAVEEQFYLLWPAALVLLGARGGARLAGAVVLAAPFVRVLLIRFGVDGLDYRPEPWADALAIGCLLAMMRPALHRMRAYRWFLRSPSPILLVLVAFIIVAHPAWSEMPPARLVGFLNELVVRPLQNVAVVLCVDWCMSNPAGRIGRLLNWRPIAGLGVLSYSLYLWQQVFFSPQNGLSGWEFVLVLPAALAAAACSYRFVERPVLQFRERVEPRIFKPRPTPARRRELADAAAD